MKHETTYSPYALEAAALLGEQISIARRQRRWSQRDLAERAGVSSRTLAKVERGDPSVGLGTAFELASLVGVPLFHAEGDSLSLDLDRARARSALLPARVRGPKGRLVDDF